MTRFRQIDKSHATKSPFFSSLLEDYEQLSPPWRDRLLAASAFNLRGAGDKDNDLVRQTRSALGA